MILRIGCFLMFIEHARVENRLYSVVYKPLHVSVRKLCGIAFRLGRNRFHSEFINLSVGQRRKLDRKAELLKKFRPKRIVFVHIEDSRNTYHTSRCGFFVKRFTFKNPL